jgi:large subunit ribosomal protein L19
MESLVRFVENEFISKKDFPEFTSGDTITVYYEIKEGEKTRTQFFRGVVIQRRGSGATETFTIRKMSGTVGVERIFPINMPALQKIEVNKRGKVRRARIFYFRGLTGKKARIKEVRSSKNKKARLRRAFLLVLKNYRPKLFRSRYFLYRGGNYGNTFIELFLCNY